MVVSCLQSSECLKWGYAAIFLSVKLVQFCIVRQTSHCLFRVMGWKDKRPYMRFCVVWCGVLTLPVWIILLTGCNQLKGGSLYTWTFMLGVACNCVCHARQSRSMRQSGVQPGHRLLLLIFRLKPVKTVLTTKAVSTHAMLIESYQFRPTWQELWRCEVSPNRQNGQGALYKSPLKWPTCQLLFHFKFSGISRIFKIKKNKNYE